ncbi:MAG: hypothetical protein GY711_02255 [bacterium]|nr:hypothetical protein [bacterium]
MGFSNLLYTAGGTGQRLFAFGVAVDGLGKVFVADYAGRARVYACF